MLLKLNGHISDCLKRAANAEQRALEASDPATRSDHELMARSWRHLANSYQFVESLERFLADTAKGKKAVALPVLSEIVQELPAPPEDRVIIRRRRVKHQTSFRERLLKSAEDAREQAKLLPPGPERAHLLQKARQSEAAVDIDQWISTPGSPPPDGLDFSKKPHDPT